MTQSAVDWIIEEIDQQQKRYIDLAKKDKSLKKEVDAILTATTLLKMRCVQAKEMEKQQLEKCAIYFTNYAIDTIEGKKEINGEKEFEQYYYETFNK